MILLEGVGEGREEKIALLVFIVSRLVLPAAKGV